MNTTRYITVVLGIIVRADDRFLLTQRHEPDHLEVHHKWQLPGGTLEKGEQPETTLHRELLEELGIEVEILDPEPLIANWIWKPRPQGHQVETHVNLVTYITQATNPNQAFQFDSETAAAKWYTSQEIENLETLPNVKELVAKAQKRIVIHSTQLPTIEERSSSTRFLQDYC